jgi:hypothetical protein
MLTKAYCILAAGAFATCSISAQDMPLTQILIENEVLRRIETVAFLRFPLQNTFGELLGSDAEADFTYGRIAIIFCDGAPAVELLELIPAGI